MTTELKKKPQSPRKELCPDCFDQGKMDSFLEYRPGRFEYFCANNHTFSDRDILMAKLAVMNAKRTPPIPPPGEAEQQMKEPEMIEICPDDKVRLAELLKMNIPDSASLVGAVYAMSIQLSEAQQALDSLKLGQNLANYKGGDLPIQVRIPERWVQPLLDIAGSGMTSVELFMQTRIEEGLDNFWFT